MLDKIAKELSLVKPLYRRPWSLYVHGLGLYSRHESREEGERAAHALTLETRGAWKVFGPIYEPNTEQYDLTFGELSPHAAPANSRKPIIV
jgi:hypothetical protein